MSKITEDPDYWLHRAKEVREMMKEFIDAETNDILEEIADGYERIARQTEKVKKGTSTN